MTDQTKIEVTITVKEIAGAFQLHLLALDNGQTFADEILPQRYATRSEAEAEGKALFTRISLQAPTQGGRA